MTILDDLDRGRVAWWGAGIALFVALAYVVHSFIGTFVFGLFIYYATRPVYRRLESRVGNRSLTAALSLFALALPAVLLLAYTVAVAIQEIESVAAEVDLSQFESMLGPYADFAAIAQDPQQLLNQPSAVDAAQLILADAVAYVGFVANGLLHLFVMFTIAYYLLKDDRRLAAWMRRRFVAEGSAIEAYGRAVDRDFSNIFFGNILNAIFTAIIGALAYNALAYVAPTEAALPYPTLLGLLTGVASLIPVVGMKLVYVPVIGYLFYLVRLEPQFVWFPVTFAAISFVIVDTIPDLVLRPYVSGRGLHLGMVMFAYIFGPLLFGWYGIFLGPMLLVLIVHFARLVLPELLLGETIAPEVYDPVAPGLIGGPKGDPPTEGPTSDAASAAPPDADTDPDPDPDSDPVSDGPAGGAGDDTADDTADSDSS